MCFLILGHTRGMQGLSTQVKMLSKPFSMSTTRRVFRKTMTGESTCTRNKLGSLISFSGVGDRKETMKYRIKTWDARHETFKNIPTNKVTREDEMNLCTVKSDLAYTYWHEERFEDVERIMEQCLEQYKKWDTEEKIPFEYGKYYHLMGFIRLWQR
jgi:hypothetical protein